MADELFVLQHLASAAIFLWLLYVHVPANARYNVWFAVAALCFDRACRAVLVCQNTRLFPHKSGCAGGRGIGHRAQLRAIGEEVTVVTVKDVGFR